MGAPQQGDIILAGFEYLEDVLHFFQHLFAFLQQCAHARVVQDDFFAAAVWSVQKVFPVFRDREVFFAGIGYFVKFWGAQAEDLIFPIGPCVFAGLSGQYVDVEFPHVFGLDDDLVGIVYAGDGAEMLEVFKVCLTVQIRLGQDEVRDVDQSVRVVL